MKKLSLILIIAAGPAFAASGPFFSLRNTDFVVLLAFLLFIGVLFYFKVPGLIGGMLDKRAEGIEKQLDDARAMREEAQKALAEFERKQKDVQEQAERIVEAARKDAEAAAEQAKIDLENSIARRMQAAEDQIASAEASAVKEVRDSAVAIAVAAAGDVITSQLTADRSGQLIDSAIDEVGSKLH